MSDTCARPGDNLVGSAATRIGIRLVAAALASSMLAGCGARSSLLDDVPIEPACAPASTASFAKRFASGEVLWTRTIDTSNPSDNYRVAAASGPAGTVFLAGGFTGTMDLGTGALSAEGDGADVFVAALPP